MDDIKLIVGAGGVAQPGFVSYEFDQLDIRNRDSWLAHYQPATITAVVAEHVLEHLQPDEALQTISNVYEMLDHGGYFRVAVPDGFNPDPKYQDWTRPQGPGQTWLANFNSYPEHKIQYDINSLSRLLESVGFVVRPLEWFDEAGTFHRQPWSESDGPIKRSAHSGFGQFYLWFSSLLSGCWMPSLIVDAIKQ